MLSNYSRSPRPRVEYDANERAPWQMGASELGEKPAITGWPTPPIVNVGPVKPYRFDTHEKVSPEAAERRAADAAGLAAERAAIAGALALHEPLSRELSLPDEVRAARFRIEVEAAG